VVFPEVVINKKVNAAGVDANIYVLTPKLQNVATEPIVPPFVKYNADGTIA
jgi:hypothetical protein